MADALPQRMKAAVYHAPHKLEVEAQPLPALGPRDALVDVSHCGICGTDLHLVLEGMGRPRSIGGHEYSGRIVKLGAEVSGWARGDRVVARPGKPPCGRCEFCRAGRTSLCATRDALGGEVEYQGAFAEYVCVHEEQLYRVPEELSLRVAALTEPMAVALHAITLSEIRPRQRALITGAGPIGCMATAVSRHAGARYVVVTDINPWRLNLALKMGATRVVDVRSERLADVQQELGMAEGFDVGLEMSGSPEAFREMLENMCHGGKIAMLGIPSNEMAIDWNTVVFNMLTI